MFVGVIILIAIIYSSVCGYLEYKAKIVLDKIINCNPNGYPYVSKFRGFENT